MLKLNKIVLTLLLSVVSANVWSDSTMTPEKRRVESVLLTVCQGKWNDTHDEFTVQVDDSCLNAINGLLQQYTKQDNTEVVDFINDFLNRFNIDTN